MAASRLTSRSPARTLLARTAWRLARNGQHAVYRTVRECERLPAERLEEFQVEALRELLQAASRIPFYRERLLAGDVAPSDVHSLRDLAAIPPLERSELQRQGIPGLAQRGAKGNVHRTSGSVGAPLEVLWPSERRPWERALYRRFHESLGVLPGEHQLALKTSGRRGSGSRLRRLPPNVSEITRSDLTDPGSFERILRMLSRRPPALVGGYSTGLYHFATMLAAEGRSLGAKACWSGGAVLPPHHRPVVEQAFGCPVYQRYACEEVGTVAHECPEGRSLHVAAETVIAEVVRDDGRPAAPGETGDVLLTDLRNHAMPIIRYRIGDIATASANRLCACGRSLPLLGGLIGRSNDVLVKGDGSVLLPGFVTDLMEDVLASVVEYRVVQHTDLGIEVSVVQRDEPDPDHARRAIAATLDDLVEIPGATGVRRVDEIPLLGVAKLRHIESHAAASPRTATSLSHDQS